MMEFDKLTSESGLWSRWDALKRVARCRSIPLIYKSVGFHTMYTGILSVLYIMGEKGVNLYIHVCIVFIVVLRIAAKHQDQLTWRDSCNYSIIVLW